MRSSQLLMECAGREQDGKNAQDDRSHPSPDALTTLFTTFLYRVASGINDRRDLAVPSPPTFLKCFLRGALGLSIPRKPISSSPAQRQRNISVAAPTDSYRVGCPAGSASHNFCAGL